MADRTRADWDRRVSADLAPAAVSARSRLGCREDTGPGELRVPGVAAAEPVHPLGRRLDHCARAAAPGWRIGIRAATLEPRAAGLALAKSRPARVCRAGISGRVRRDAWDSPGQSRPLACE